MHIECVECNSCIFLHIRFILKPFLLAFLFLSRVVKMLCHIFLHSIIALHDNVKTREFNFVIVLR